MTTLRLLFAITLLLCLTCRIATAGDAVVIGYNVDGVWTSVMYYSSSTGKGGADYKDEAGAREAATRDLKKRAGEGVVRTEVLASSDRTAHVVYARGKTKDGKDMHAVGYGATEAEAQKKAFDDLDHRGASNKKQAIYRYFTHGADASTKPAGKQ